MDSEQIERFINIYNDIRFKMVLETNPKNLRGMKVWMKEIGDPLKQKLEAEGIELKEIM